MRSGNLQGEIPAATNPGLTTQVSINMTFSDSTEDPRRWKSTSIWSILIQPYSTPLKFTRGKEYLLKIRKKRIFFPSWNCHPWLHAYEVVSLTTCYLCCQRRRNRGRLDKVKRSGLLKFKVLKWPIINTSDGPEAVISENDSNIISPSKRPPLPWGTCQYARVGLRG